MNSKTNSKPETQFCSPVVPNYNQMKPYSRCENDKSKSMLPTVGVSLSDENMMNISHSIDSLNTVGSNGTVDINDQVRTLFISGLPMDTKPRELYLLFRGYKGFESAQIKSFSEKLGKLLNGYISSTLKPSGKNGKLTAPVGFVTFSSREEAEIAMSELQGVKFDPDSAQQMRLEFARSNTKVTRPKIGLFSLSQPFFNAGLPPHAIIQQFPGFDHGSLLSADTNWANLGYDNAILTATGILPSATPNLHPSLLQALMPQNGLNGGVVSTNCLPSQILNQNIITSQSSLTNPYLGSPASSINGATISYPGLVPLGFSTVGLLSYNALMKDLVNN